MTAKCFSVPNPLKRMVGLRTGVGRSDAVLRAEANLESIRESAMSQIDAVLQEIEAVASQASGSAEARARLYALSNHIFSTAGVFGLKGLGQAAYSLCELVDRSEEAGCWSPAGVNVHIQSMRILRHTTAEEHQAALLRGLAQVLAHVMRPEDLGAQKN